MSFTESFDEFLRFANAYHADAVLRVETDANPVAALSKVGIDLPPGVEPQIALNTGELLSCGLSARPERSTRGRIRGMS